MAVGASTLTAAGGAVSDIFAGFAALDQGALRAQGQRITAAGTRIGAESTRLSAEGLRIKAGGDIAEAENYDLAAALARTNESYTDFSTRVSIAQEMRQATASIGGTRAGVAGAGFATSGSALDILRDSASQGALARGVMQMQGNITEAGFEEQAKAYETMAAAGRTTAAGEQDIAGRTDLIAGQQEDIATQQMGLADQTEAAAKKAATGDFITGAIKSVAAIASIGLAPVTGGLSLLALPAVAGAPTGGSAAP